MCSAGLTVNWVFVLSKTLHITRVIHFLHFQRARDIIKSHNASKPLFLYMAFQNVHWPDQAPQKYTDKYSFIGDKTRRIYAGMVDIMDEAVGNITEAMKDAGYDTYDTNDLC